MPTLGFSRAARGGVHRGPASGVSMATITGIGSALPAAPSDQRDLWDGFFAEHFHHDRMAAAVWRHAGIRSRHGVADPRDEDLSTWSTGQRMRRFAQEALPLGKEAVAASLQQAGRTPSQIDALVAVSCTGYTTPGMDVLLGRDLGMPSDLQRLHVGHMGCYAALPALATASDAVTARGRTAVVISVELTSLHVQPAEEGRPDREQVVAHALFADAAGAVVIEPDGAADRTARSAADGFTLVDFAARTDAQHADLMTWDITDAGFRMGLSPKVPEVLAEHVRPSVGDLLARHGLGLGDVAAWAVHPGGPRIVDTVAEELGLGEADVAESRAVLAEVGNCSSATILLILERLARRGLPRGAPVVALAFGPGLTLHAALLRAA